VKNAPQEVIRMHIVHALPDTKFRTGWIVRTDRAGDIRFASEDKALEYARALAQQLATRHQMSIVLRRWLRHGRFVDEVIKPPRSMRSRLPFALAA
jgi:hypothetical protein